MQNTQELSDIRVYDGQEPYIFVSYAHKDSHLVIPAVLALQQRGYRVWFDMGIEAGTEWSNNIASHLRDCAAFVFFVSANSAASENCLDEVAFAKSNKKPSLMVFLEPDVVLPDGTEMQTARFQRMFKYRYESMNTFMSKLCEAPILAACRDQEAAVVPETPRTEVPVPEKHRAAEPARVSAQERPKKQPLKLLIPIIAVVLAAAVLLALLLPGGKNGTPDPSVPATAAPVPTTVPATTVPATTAPLVLSENLLDFSFRLEGQVYRLPFAYQQLKDRGWSMRSSVYNEDTLLGGMAYESVYLQKGDLELTVRLYNYSGNAKPLGDCLVGAIVLDHSGPEFQLPGGICDLNLTRERLTELYGSYSTLTEQQSGFTMTFQPADQSATVATVYARFFIDTSDSANKYSYVLLQNFVTTEADKTETDTTVPEYLSQYLAPTTPGGSPTSRTVELDGDLYSLPAPLRAFLDKGWTLSNPPEHLVAGDTDTVTLRRGDKTLEVRIKNFSTKQTIPENCAVYSIFQTSAGDDLLMLGSGVRRGTSLAIARAAAGSAMTEQSSESGITFSFYSEGHSVSYKVDSKTQCVDWISISVSYWPYGTD